jgi:vacuolar-type H+-ATPase subunit H
MIVKGKEIVANPEISKFIENSQNLLEELFASNLRSRTKQRREAVKLYQHINVFAHDAVI